MRFFRHGPRGQERAGMVDARGGHRDLSALVLDFEARHLADHFASFAAIDPERLPLVAEQTRIGAPVADVGKIICIGLNYADHAREAGMQPPTEPVVFMKATSTIVGPNDDVQLPKNSTKSDWEVELGVVIGREARYVSVEHALSHIAGLCVINDLSERAFQLERGGQWDKGKSCDTFAPIGPYLVTLDEIADVANLELWCDVNGQRMQAGNTRDMIFNVPYLVHYVSQFMSLQPGDIISTGTPAGVGMARKPPVWLQAGDEMSLGISGLGQQRQRVRPHGGSANQ
ncbi:fumarylacetoacetate hydrolase family protein [Steroidobacter sp.]|uniref:fumarylacetoacetate hydrolase family protein n=1 Tax=Steroidobacter sp. TaxID=1978227 RepID=UPI001A4B2E3C|nr:fumarylacetoacetate hydrolase family protein [Steroidobacter sp.]MBL8267080.1 fumarylacetoacetate hydrolase family protein [Steroidobacter sp.]